MPQFVTFRLYDSVPAQVLEQWREELAALEPEAAALLRAKRIERYLDGARGSCVLADPRLATIVAGALQFFDGKRYRLHAWVIMPNHIHVLFTPFPDEQLGAIIKSWKEFTAKAINRVLGRTGRLWAPDYFDRRARDLEHFERLCAYIEQNPVKAGLCRAPGEWAFLWRRSSGSAEDWLVEDQPSDQLPAARRWTSAGMRPATFSLERT